MAYTAHGHHIEDTGTENEPAVRARCGGPKICDQCARDALNQILHVRPIYEEDMHSDSQHKPDPIMQFFKSKHLPPALAHVSQSFEKLARDVDENIPCGTEKSVALRKLLEAKDAAVRASLDLV